jgi:UDP-N-acetylglucosamine acyltransferase
MRLPASISLAPMIHPTAIVGPTVSVPEGCSIGPYSVIEDGVVLGDSCRIDSNVVVRSGTILGKNVAVHSGAVLGGAPQDLGFDAKIRSGVRIGDNTVIRETVTISRGSKEGAETLLGNGCFLMAGSHVAHDCVLGDRVVLANLVMLAGYVTIGKFSFLGGGAGIHQFCRVGESVMVGGNASISMDLAPFTIVADRNRMSGLNLVGLKRRGFTRETIADIKRCFAAVFGLGMSPRAAAATALEGGVARTPEGEAFLEFFRDGKRGFARPRRGGPDES